MLNLYKPTEKQEHLRSTFREKWVEACGLNPADDANDFEWFLPQELPQTLSNLQIRSILDAAQVSYQKWVEWQLIPGFLSWFYEGFDVTEHNITLARAIWFQGLLRRARAGQDIGKTYSILFENPKPLTEQRTPVKTMSEEQFKFFIDRIPPELWDRLNVYKTTGDWHDTQVRVSGETEPDDA